MVYELLKLRVEVFVVEQAIWGIRS